VIGLAPLGVAVLLCSWTLWLVLQTTLVCSGAGMRYHRVLRLARPPGGLDIQGFYRLVRTYHAGLDITLTISILEVWGVWCPLNLLARQRFGGHREKEEISKHDIMAHSCRMSR